MKQVEISKSSFGRYVVGYNCPYCHERLKSSLKNAGKPEECPSCHRQLVVPGEQQLAELQKAKAEKLQAKLQAANAVPTVPAETTDTSRPPDLEVVQELEQPSSRRPPPIPSAPPATRSAERRALPAAVYSNPASLLRSKKSRWLAGGICLLFVILFSSFGSIRSYSLKRTLWSCSSYEVVQANVYYRGLTGRVIVFDVPESSKCRMIDPMHLLMQFGAEIELDDVDEVILANSGDDRFSVSGEDLSDLAYSYDRGKERAAFNHLPERVKTATGSKPYGRWTGGALGVMTKQMEDLNSLLKAWLL